MSMQNLLCRDDNEPCIQEFSIENPMEQAVSMMDESDERKSAHAASDADEDCYIKPPSVEEQLKVLSISKWIIQDGHCADKAAIRGVVHSQIHLRHLRTVSMKRGELQNFSIINEAVQSRILSTSTVGFSAHSTEIAQIDC